ncbi:hypothetical protein BJ165DRAFT_1409798 [Panaeolus papilionaceus]|nr:hypothetical protein BJ165DRAFT_1409798 [Panaeolus papilionaceus]
MYFAGGTEYSNPNTLSDPALEESDSNFNSGSGLKLGSDEFGETTREGGKVEVRAQDDMKGGGSDPLTGILAKVWGLTIEQQEAQYKDDLREASGVGRKRRKKGHHTEPILSHRVKYLIGDGILTYVDNNLHEAIIHEVMRALHSLHGVLSRAVTVICSRSRCWERLGGGGDMERRGLATMGDVDEDEGKYHASIILTSDVLDSSVLFLGIADGCFEKEAYEDVNVIYQLLEGEVAKAETDNLPSMLSRQAAYTSCKQRHPFPQKAQNQLGPTGTPAPAPSTGEDPTVTSHFAENKFLNASKAKSGGAGSETEADVGVVEGAGGGEGEGSCEGGGGAMKRRVETKADEDRMADRLQLDIQQNSLTQQNTKSMGVTYYILKKRAQYNVAEEILCILAERPGVAVEQVCKLMTTHQFNNEPIRILLTSLASGLKLTNSFITSTLQEYLFRETKHSDTAVKNLGIPCASGKRKTGDAEKEDEDDETPTPMGGGGAGATASVDGAPRIPTKGNPGMTTAGVREVEDDFGRTFHQLGLYPAPSTTEDPTITSLFTENKSVNVSRSEAKPGGLGAKPRLTSAQLRALEAEREREVVRGRRRCSEGWEGMLRKLDGGEGEGEGAGGGDDER